MSPRPRPRNRRRKWSLIALTLCGFVALACEREAAKPTPEPEAKSQTETPAAKDAAQAPTEPEASPSEKKPSEIAALIRWVDPESQGLLIRRRHRPLDPELLATVFGWPPRAIAMWRELDDARAHFAALPRRDKTGKLVEGEPIQLVDPEAPSLVFKPALANGNYIVLRHAAGDTAAAQLEAAGFQTPLETVAGTLVVQTSPSDLRWRAVVLDAQHFALISRAEIGSGLAPLTAGRDFPNSEAKAQVLGVLEADPNLEALQRATGPMVHFDLDTDILMIETSLRSWQRGLDYQARMVVEEEPGKAASALRSRSLEDENHQLRSLAGRVAFEVEQGVVASRLQLTRDDLRQLRRR